MSVTTAQFEPGWLMRVSHDAHVRCMADHSPLFFAQIKIKQTKRPISRAEAFEVFKRMDKRFEAWTGMTLAEFVETQEKPK